MAAAKKRKKKNTYLVSFYLYKRGSPEERKQEPAFRANGFAYYLVDFDLHSATIKASEFPNREAINKRILKHLSREGDANETITPEYTEIIQFLKRDEEFEQWLQVFESYGYPNPVDDIEITDVELMSEDGEKYNIVTENLRDAVHVSFYHRYVHTPIAQNADTLKEAFSKGHYIDNECWINLLTDYYADTIMNEMTLVRRGHPSKRCKRCLENIIYKWEYITFSHISFINMTHQEETAISKHCTRWLRIITSMH